MFNLFNNSLRAGDLLVKTPDFRYPQTVSKDAQKALDQAIAQRDGNAIVLSLVQIGLAQTSISRNNFNDVCKKIDAVLAKDGLLTPDYRSILYLIEAQIVSAAPYDVKKEEKYDAYQLCKQALNPLGNGDFSALRRPLSDYGEVISLGSELGQRCIPTLYDFAMMQYCNRTYICLTRTSCLVSISSNIWPMAASILLLVPIRFLIRTKSFIRSIPAIRSLDCS